MSLERPNWNEAKNLDPIDLANQVDARLEAIAKEHNANPSKFMAKLNGSGDTFGFGDMKMSSGIGDGPKEDKSASSSQFLMMGKGKTKLDRRWEQMKSGTDAMGMSLSYSEKKRIGRIMSGGRAGRQGNDAFGNTDKELAERVRITRQSLGTEGGYISPQGIKANPHLAMQLGAAKEFETKMDALHENDIPSEQRAINGALDGNDKLKPAAQQISASVKEEYTKKLDDDQPVRQALGMAPPSPNNGGGLMG